MPSGLALLSIDYKKSDNGMQANPPTLLNTTLATMKKKASI